MASTKEKETASPAPAKIVAQYTAHTPSHFTEAGVEYHLYQGENYTLPECAHVRSMLASGKLKRIP